MIMENNRNPIVASFLRFPLGVAIKLATKYTLWHLHVTSQCSLMSMSTVPFLVTGKQLLTKKYFRFFLIKELFRNLIVTITQKKQKKNGKAFVANFRLFFRMNNNFLNYF